MKTHVNFCRRTGTLTIIVKHPEGYIGHLLVTTQHDDAHEWVVDRFGNTIHENIFRAKNLENPLGEGVYLETYLTGVVNTVVRRAA